MFTPIEVFTCVTAKRVPFIENVADETLAAFFADEENAAAWRRLHVGKIVHDLDAECPVRVVDLGKEEGGPVTVRKLVKPCVEYQRMPGLLR